MEKQALVFVLLLVAMAGVFVLLWRIGAAMAQKALDNLRVLAGRLKISVVEKPKKFGVHPPPEAVGFVRGKQVRLFNYTTGTGKSKTTWSAIAVTPAVASGLSFELLPQGFGSKVLELFGARELQVGDAAFDKKWFVRCNQPAFFAAALLPEIRQKIMGSAAGRWKLQEGIVTYSELGLFSDAARCERFTALADVACDLADLAEVFARRQT
ncbi:MAG: hypothetical protein IT582_01045 [Opitutaceae bacterium]|nr:hypothetical protein [Opitutaceae bacterium]